jgi:subtilisin-like proprotein convertase family protein
MTGPLTGEVLYLQAGTIQTEKFPDLLDSEEPFFDRAEVRILVLDRPLSSELRADLEDLGVQLLDYLPLNCFTVRLSGVSRLQLSRVPGVIRVVEYRESWRLQPGIVEKLGTHQEPTRRELDEQGLLALIVSLHPGTDLPSAITDLRRTGVVVRMVERIGRHDELSVVATPEQLNPIVQLDGVLFVEDAPDITFRNNTTRWIVQTNLTNQTPVYSNGIHGEDQVIGVLDGRVDQSHCSFSGGKIIAYNSTPGSDTHGTHVAGTAAGNNGSDANTRGIAYEASLVVNTVPAFTEAGIVNRLNTHHGQGGRLHTNSWGNDGTTSYDSLARGFDVFLRSNEDSFVCLAVTNGSSLRNPENAKNLLAVGASQDTPSQASHCSGGVGPTSDGRRKPEVYAPGCGTQSSSAGTACGTTGLTGTSMACPAVAGASALVRQYYVNGYYPTGSPNPADGLIPTGALIKATVINSAVDMTGVSGYPSNLEGWGRIRIDDPLFFVGDSRTLGVLDDVRNADGLGTGQVITYNVNVNGPGQDLRITAVWTDVAATAGTAFASINDLDLEVTSPGGVLFRGNVFSGGFSSSGGTRDDRNNVEQVHINNPASGAWTVRIRAAAVNSGTQGYSLIASGDIQLAPPDCNANGIPDETDIAAGTSSDCDGNGIPDECQEDCNQNGIADPCDISSGSSTDCDGNAVPDECQPDCNLNGVADACDISGGLEIDCDGNTVPDSCDIASGAGDCDGNGAIDTCEIAGGASDCNLNGSLDGCDISSGTSADCNGNGIPDECDAVSVNTYSSNPAAPVPPVVSDNIVVADSGTILDLDVQLNITHVFIGDLIVDVSSPAGTTVRLHNETGLDSDDINTTYDDDGAGTIPAQPLSAVDSQQKQGTWNLEVTDVFPSADSGVVNTWALVIEAQGSGFNDCNNNGVADECEIASGTAADCNGNEIPDSCDIAAGTSADTNGNGIPDECDVTDCNNNGIPDDQDIANGTAADCNANTIPDSCDIADGMVDCDQDGVPDSCELVSGTGQDCNLNGTLDSCDIASGSSTDANGNGIPDSCEVTQFIRGDTNTDATVDIADVVFMLVFLFDGGLDSPCSDTLDCNDDGARDISDPVQLLLYLFGSGADLPPPSPGCGGDPTADAITCVAYPPCP